MQPVTPVIENHKKSIKLPIENPFPSNIKSPVRRATINTSLGQ